MRILVTGAAGFIGYHTVARFAALGHSVVGMDNLNDYYDPQLKRDRLELLSGLDNFCFVPLDLADEAGMTRLFAEQGFTHVIHLAAQAGVRYSLKNPHSYVRSNLEGFLNVLEGCRHNGVEHLVYASSSSVYGLNASMPFSTSHSVDHPVSLYAASKKSNELMAHAYSHLYRLPSTGLRFFTVYGPWGRPDMAPCIFTQAIREGKPIPVFNEGNMQRDFTYIDDIVDGIISIAAIPATPAEDWDPASPDPAKSPAPYALYNIGNNRPMPLKEFIALLENALKKKAVLQLLPMQPGDVQATCADIEPLRKIAGFTPKTELAEGIARYVAWHLEYYK